MIKKRNKIVLSISKKEWLSIGQNKKWLNTSSWNKDLDIEQPGKWSDYSKTELIDKRDAARKRQNKRKKSGKKANPKDTELLRELNFAIRAKSGWGKAE